MLFDMVGTFAWSRGDCRVFSHTVQVVYIYSIGSHHLLQNQSGRTHPTAIIQEPIRTLHGRRIGIHWPWSEGPPVNRIGGLDFDTTTTLRVSVLCQKELHITHIGLS